MEIGEFVFLKKHGKLAHLRILAPKSFHEVHMTRGYDHLLKPLAPFLENPQSYPLHTGPIPRTLPQAPFTPYFIPYHFFSYKEITAVDHTDPMVIACPHIIGSPNLSLIHFFFSK